MRGVGREEESADTDSAPTVSDLGSAFHLHSLIFAAAVGGGYYYCAHLTDGKTKAWARSVTSLLSHSG